MRKKILFAGVIATLMMAQTAFAGVGWQKNSTGWWYATNDAGTTWHTNGWQWLDGNKDGIAECYDFDQNGYMYQGTTTPDGYTVNENGAWTVNGVVQTKNVATGTGSGSTSGGSGSSGFSSGSGSSSSSSATGTSAADTSVLKYGAGHSEVQHADGVGVAEYLGIYVLDDRTDWYYDGTSRGVEYAILTDGTLHTSGTKYDSYVNRVSDTMWKTNIVSGCYYTRELADGGDKIVEKYYTNNYKNEKDKFVAGSTWVRVAK